MRVWVNVDCVAMCVYACNWASSWQSDGLYGALDFVILFLEVHLSDLVPSIHFKLSTYFIFSERLYDQYTGGNSTDILGTAQ